MAKHGKKIKQEEKPKLGQRIRYIGFVDTFCPQCNARQRKGMLSVYEGQRFCGEPCIERFVSTQ